MSTYNSAELGQALFEEAGDALLLFDPETEQLLDANPMTQRLSGYPRQEVLRMQVSYLFRSEEQSGLQRFRNAFRKTGVFHSQEGFFLRHQQDGVWVPVNLTITRLHTETGTLGLITARDITERREALAQLKTMESRLRTVISNAPVVLFAMDRDGVFTLSEGKALETLGLKAGAVVGQSVFALYRDAPQIIANMRRALAGESFTAAVEVEAGPGKGLFFETHHAPLRDSRGQVHGMIGIATDITERMQAEQALRTNEERLTRIVETIADGITIADREGRLVFANSAAEKILGLPRSAILARNYNDPGWTIMTLDGKPVTDENRSWYRIMKKGHAMYGFDAMIGRPDGSRVVVSARAAPLRDAQGHIVGVISSLTDITERKRSEAVLRESEARLAEAQRIAHLGNWEENLETGAMIWSDEAFHLLGLAPGAVAPSRNYFVRHIHPDDRRRVLAAIRATLEQDKTYDEQFRLVRVDGETRVLHARGKVHRDHTGRPVRFVGTALDITERRQVEEALRESNATLHTLIQASPLAILSLDTHGHVHSWNTAAERIFGWSEQEVLGRPVPFVPEEQRQDVQALRQHLLSGGSFTDMEARRLTKHGALVDVSISAAPLFDSQGNVRGIMAIIADIAERKRLEDQLRQAQKMDAIGQLAGGVAHDFNNLMTAILGNVSLLLAETPADASSHPLLQATEMAAWRAAELTRQLLGFSRQTMLQLRPFHLHKSADETVALLHRTIDPRIAVEVQADPELWTVQADPGQMNQVLMNLCLNARDAMPEGGRLLLEVDNVVVDSEHARSRLEARAGEFVRLRVSDTGHGMSPEVRARIFEPFFTTKEFGKGTGLGLAVVFGIVKQHHGWIECTSEPGRGTTFSICVPRLVPGSTPGLPSTLSRAPTTASGGR